MVDAEATAHTIKDISKFKTFNDSFQPDNRFIALVDGTRTKGVALKRGDAGRYGRKPRDSLSKRDNVYTFLSTEYTFLCLSRQTGGL